MLLVHLTNTCEGNRKCKSVHSSDVHCFNVVWTVVDLKGLHKTKSVFTYLPYTRWQIHNQHKSFPPAAWWAAPAGWCVTEKPNKWSSCSLLCNVISLIHAGYSLLQNSAAHIHPHGKWLSLIFGFLVVSWWNALDVLTVQITFGHIIVEILQRTEGISTACEDIPENITI